VTGRTGPRKILEPCHPCWRRSFEKRLRHQGYRAAEDDDGATESCIMSTPDCRSACRGRNNRLLDRHQSVDRGDVHSLGTDRGAILVTVTKREAGTQLRGRAGGRSARRTQPRDRDTARSHRLACRGRDPPIGGAWSDPLHPVQVTDFTVLIEVACVGRPQRDFPTLARNRPGVGMRGRRHPRPFGRGGLDRSAPDADHAGGKRWTIAHMSGRGRSRDPRPLGRLGAPPARMERAKPSLVSLAREIA